MPSIKTVMVVDDDPDDHDIFEIYLKEFQPNIAILHANSGLEALQLLQNIIPECIFIDANMPRLSGIELIKEIQKKPELRSIHVCLLSSSGTLNPLEESNGVRLFLKPQTKEDLQKIFDEVCGE